MIDLVLGSFLIALTPPALGLAWKVLSCVGDQIGHQAAPQEAANAASFQPLRH